MLMTPRSPPCPLPEQLTSAFDEWKHYKVYRAWMPGELLRLHEDEDTCRIEAGGWPAQPISPNQATVSASASPTGRGRNPSIAKLRCGSKCMRRRVNLTPVTVAAGVRCVSTSASHSLT